MNIVEKKAKYLYLKFNKENKKVVQLNVLKLL